MIPLSPDTSKTQPSSENSPLKTPGEGQNGLRLVLFGILLGLASAGLLLWLLWRPVPATITLHPPATPDAPQTAPIAEPASPTQPEPLESNVSVDNPARSLSVEVNAGTININTATLAELETLPGIGAVRAAAIVAGRPYRSVDELDDIEGIGPATLEKLRPLVRVE